MKQRLIFLLLLILFMPGMLSAADLSSVTGYWKTIDDETGKAKSIVHIYEQNGVIKGKIVKLIENPDAKCTKCKGSLKNKPVVGMNIIWGVKKLGEKSGKILNPKNGKIYTLKLWRSGSNLMVRGYIAFFYKTQKWLQAQKP